MLLLQLRVFLLLGYVCVLLSGLIPAPWMLLLICWPILGHLPLIGAVHRLIVCCPAGMRLSLPGPLVLHPACLPGTGLRLLVRLILVLPLLSVIQILPKIIRRNMLLPTLWMLSVGFRTKVAFPLLLQKAVRFAALDADDQPSFSYWPLIGDSSSDILHDLDDRITSATSGMRSKKGFKLPLYLGVCSCKYYHFNGEEVSRSRALLQPITELGS